MIELEKDQRVPPQASETLKPHLLNEPNLMVTPEKPLSVLNKGLPRNENVPPKLPSGVLTGGFSEIKPPPKEMDNTDLIPTRLNKLMKDPTLDVTPEKPQPVLKKVKKDEILLGEAAQTTKSVRFDVPDSVGDRSIDSTMDNEQATDSGTGIRKELSPDRSHERQQPFQLKAALYAQRNPLADITQDTSMQDSSDNTTASSETFISNESESSSLFNQIAQYIERNPPPDVLDLKGKVIGNTPQVSQILPKVKLKTEKGQSTVVPPRPKSAKSKIINVVPQEKQGPPRALIDQLTKPKRGTQDSQKPESKQAFLRKKAGLHRHEHSIRYKPEKNEDNNVLSEPTYNTTLGLGQELQELKIAECDAEGMVKKKLAESETLRNYVAEKTAEATNIDPDEKLYQNLVSVEVPPDELVSGMSVAWKRIKPKPLKPKKLKHAEPNIMDTFSPDLFHEQLIFDLDAIQVSAPVLTQSPLDSIMSLDEHSQIWNNV